MPKPQILHALPPPSEPKTHPTNPRLRYVRCTLRGFEDVAFWYNPTLSQTTLLEQEQRFLDQAYPLATAQVDTARARQLTREGWTAEEKLADAAYTLRQSRIAEAAARQAALDAAERDGTDPPDAPEVVIPTPAEALADVTAEDKRAWRTEREQRLRVYGTHIGAMLALAAWDSWPFAGDPPTPTDLQTWEGCPVELSAWIGSPDAYREQIRPDPKSRRA